MQQAQPYAGTEGAHPFRPNVIRGNFTGVLTGRPTPAADAPAPEMVQLPLYGKIAAGTPIEALRDHSAFVDVPTSLLGPGHHYPLPVECASLVDPGTPPGPTGKN